MLLLNLLAIRTLGHILRNVLLHAIPPIDLLKIMIHLGGTWLYEISGLKDISKRDSILPQSILELGVSLPT